MHLSIPLCYKMTKLTSDVIKTTKVECYYVNPSNIQRFTTNGIEAVSATIQLPHILIAVVYRSPSDPKQHWSLC